MRDRLFRLIGKKKGTRQTGSPWWRIFIDVLFSAALVIIGLILIAATITFQVQYWNEQPIGWISFGTQSLIGILFFGFGLYQTSRTLWLIGASAERRSALVSLARDVELFNELGSEEPALPNVPSPAFAKKEAGRRLNFRLPRQGLGQMTTWISAVMTLTFIVVSTVLVMYCVQSINDGSPRWLLMVLTAIHLLATLFQIYTFMRQLLRSSALGPTRIEISNVPVAPGSNVHLFFSQSGRLFMKLVDIELVCFEQTTFNQGTDIRTEQKPVYRQRIFRRTWR